jgi:carboxyl-terminal processing protease
VTTKEPAVRAAAIAFAVLAPFAARAGEPPDNFSDWKNRPRETFADGARAFERARKLLLEHDVDDKLGDAELWRAAVAGMAAGGGRKWDRLLSPAELAELQTELSGEIAGVGVEISFDSATGVVTVGGVMPGSPAERGGLLGGDRILKIDGRSYKGENIRDVVASVRGRVGTSVRVTVLRDDRIFDATLTRAPIAMALVVDTMLDGGVALLRVRSFNDKTPAQLKAALGRIAAAGPRALVIDLRDDMGGLLERMVECAGLLIPRGRTVATSIGRGGREQALTTTADPVLPALPTAVLVDGNTASSAEILAAALKQHLGARVVGKKTLGKWNVQRIEELPNRWALKFTVGVFKSAGGELLDGRGLEPDVEVEMDAATVEKAWHAKSGEARLAQDPQLRTAVSLVRPR